MLGDKYAYSSHKGAAATSPTMHTRSNREGECHGTARTGPRLCVVRRRAIVPKTKEAIDDSVTVVVLC